MSMSKISPFAIRLARRLLQTALAWSSVFFIGGVAAQVQVAAPTMAPQTASAYPVTQNITVSCATSEAVIHYTSNG